MFHALRKDMLSSEKQLTGVGLGQALEKEKKCEKESWEATKENICSFTVREALQHDNSKTVRP